MKDTMASRIKPPEPPRSGNKRALSNSISLEQNSKLRQRTKIPKAHFYKLKNSLTTNADKDFNTAINELKNIKPNKKPNLIERKATNVHK